MNYDAVVNYAGNSFAKDSWKMIQEANPLTKERHTDSTFMNMIAKAPVISEKMKEEISWAM